MMTESQIALVKVLAGKYTSKPILTRREAILDYFKTFCYQFNTIMSTKQLSLDFKLELYESDPLIFDRRILELALFHVLMNAIKFSQPRQTITILV